MGSDPVPASEPAPDSEVMASIDGDDHDPRLVIADITADESWISIPAGASVNLVDWR